MDTKPPTRTLPKLVMKEWPGSSQRDLAGNIWKGNWHDRKYD